MSENLQKSSDRIDRDPEENNVQQLWSKIIVREVSRHFRGLCSSYWSGIQLINSIIAC